MVHWGKRALAMLFLLLVLASLGGGFHWGSAAAQSMAG